MAHTMQASAVLRSSKLLLRHISSCLDDKIHVCKTTIVQVINPGIKDTEILLFLVTKVNLLIQAYDVVLNQ
jgi:hypothetical protein